VALLRGFELNGYGSWVHCSQFTENSVTDTVIQFNDTTNTATRNFFDRGAGSSFDGVCYDEAQLYMHAQLIGRRGQWHAGRMISTTRTRWW